MTEGPVTRSKRVGARFFKNPPQPHMCIRDYLKESWHACYINVLSWDKIEMATCPSDGLPLYGGMKINPPRTENPQSAVFFVMANPEILRRNGKNAQDLKEQSSLIELLLDFVEAMNEGVVFKRLYKILDDRDITGELKEIWSIVQSDRAKAQDTFVSEEVLRPVPQYPQYQDQSQNQQKLQQQQQHQKSLHQQQPPQQYRQPPPQQHQHQLQQMQTQHQHQQQHQQQQQQQQQQQLQQPQPPQYHYNFINHRPVEKCENFDLRDSCRDPITNNSQNDRIYQLLRVKIQNNVNMGDQLYNFQYQQLPRPVSHYPTANCHPNANLVCPNMANPGMPPVINHGINPAPQIHYVSMHSLENNVYVKLHRMQQPQQPQLQLAHAPPVRRYETIDAFYEAQTNAQLGYMNIYGPHTNTSAKNSSNKRQINSPIHANYCSSPVVKENLVKSKSPVKVLQRDSVKETSDRVQISDDTVRSATLEKKMVQVTDLDEDEPRGQIVSASDRMVKSESVEELGKLTPELSCKFIPTVVTESCDNSPQQSASTCNVYGDDSDPKGKTKIMVLKRNNSCNDGGKVTLKDGKVMKNGATCGVENQQNYDVNGKTIDREPSNNIRIGRESNGYNDKETIDIDVCPKDTLNIVQKMQKINSSTSQITNNDPNGQINGQSKNNDKEKDGVHHQVYTILRKPDSTSSQDAVTNEMAQLSIKECTDSSEVGAVPS